MACPYFFPTDRFAESAWPKHPRLPLGDPYRGVCRADPMRERLPGIETLRECCNMGRAGRRCSHFPKEGGSDALRYSVASDEGGLIRIFYVAERENRSIDHGTVEFETETGLLRDGHTGETLQKQARAYVESYLRRKQQPDERSKDLLRRITEEFVFHRRDTDSRRRIDCVASTCDSCDMKDGKFRGIRVMAEVIAERPLQSTLARANDAFQHEFGVSGDQY